MLNQIIQFRFIMKPEKQMLYKEECHHSKKKKVVKWGCSR